MKKFLLMFTLVGLVIFGCNYSYARDGITYNDNLTTWTDLNGNSFEYGTITIEHNGNSITMMDRNLGATTNNINSNRSFGYYYQRGNNYGFSSNFELLRTGENPVNASSYGPGNYYSRAIYTVSPRNEIYERDRSTVRNDNLWGGSGDNFDNNYLGYPVQNPTDRQGPCPDGYHVPSMGERLKVIEWRALNNDGTFLDYTNNFGRPGLSGGISTFRSDFFIPESKSFATHGLEYEEGYLTSENVNFLRSSSSIPYASGYCDLDGCISYNRDYRDSRALYLYTPRISSVGEGRILAAPIRCFKNPGNSTTNVNPSSSGGNGNNSNFNFDYSQFDHHYSDEMNKAYQYAYHYGITTMSSINNANMDGGLNRIAMAKMLSYYAENVLGMDDYDTRRNCEFNDVSVSLDERYNNGVTKACQLGIMGINMNNNNFNPYGSVTRAQFATALSRLLYGTRDGTDNYYSTHIAKLYSEGIISNTNPNLPEKRGYVMLMLMRSDKNFVPGETPASHTYSVNKIDTIALGIATPGCNWLTRTQNSYGYDADMPNKNWTEDVKFVNKALQDVRDNGQHIVKNYVNEANRVLDSAGLTTRDQCRYSLLIDELENQKGYLKTYRKENGKTIVGIDFVSYKESISGDDFHGISWELMKNTSTKLRYYTLSDDAQLELLNVNANGYTNEDEYHHDRKYLSDWNTWINAFCNNEPVYNWTQEGYNRNEFGRLCTKNMIGKEEYNNTLINFRFDSAGDVDRISGLNYWLTLAS